jgi:ferrous iron transport protein B
MSELATAGVSPRVALVGNPNCGKTALFNRLTGSRQHVANYPGVTVERKEGALVTPAGFAVRLLDLPGTYSLRARSPDEEITRDVVLGRLAGEDAPEILVCVADATNLRLAIRLVLELKHVGRPMLLALNMFDIARHRGVTIDIARLQAELGIPVIPSVAVRRGGTAELLDALDRAIGDRLAAPAGEAPWHEPNVGELRNAQREADRILRLVVDQTGERDRVTARIDRIVLHPVLGLVVLLVLLFVMFQAVFAWAEPLMGLIEGGFGALADWTTAVLPDGLFRSFVHDAVIAGVGGVLVFLPQIVILFLFILLLEDLGYMARAAFLMDKIMGGAGLHGRAFIPLLSSFACAIPGIMSTRVIDSRHDRLATILVAPLMTCSARIPVYTLIISAFIPQETVWGGLGLQGLVMFGLYAVGIFSALAVSFMMKRVFWRDQPPEPFMLELPDYKLPRPMNVLLGLWQRAKAFLRRAGTIIFAMTVVIWFLSSFPRPPDDAANSGKPDIEYSLAATIGNVIEPVLRPIGFNWQISVALIPGMAAREVAVAALGTVYAISEKDESGETSADALGTALAGKWSLATALAFLAWYIFAPQCASTLAVMRRETGSTGWMMFAFGYMVALAYFAAFVTYRVTLALGGG